MTFQQDKRKLVPGVKHCKVAAKGFYLLSLLNVS